MQPWRLPSEQGSAASFASCGRVYLPPQVIRNSAAVIEDGTYDGANSPALHVIAPPLAGCILHNLVRKPGDGKRLQPHAPGPGQQGQEQSVAAEDHVLDPRHARNLKRYAARKRAHMAGM